MRLEFFVRGKRLTRKGRSPLVGDTAGHYTFTVDFDEEWDGLQKLVVFRNGETSAEVRYTGEAEIPANVCGSGTLEVACHGYRTVGEHMTVLRTIRMTRPLQLMAPGPQGGCTPGKYTPTLFEQILLAVRQARDAGAAARAMEQTLQTKLDRGDFLGPMGPRGLPGKNGVDGKDGVNGTDGLPGRDGINGRNGAPGRDGTNGKNGEPGKDGIDGKDGHTPVRGVDYWTQADRQAVVQDTLQQLPVWTGGAY